MPFGLPERPGRDDRAALYPGDRLDVGPGGELMVKGGSGSVPSWDERMHTTHFSHATKLANVPPTNLIQIGIGGWIGNHAGIQVAEEGVQASRGIGARRRRNRLF